MVESNRPGPRCGHSLTALRGMYVNEEGKVVQCEGMAILVLFGGATSLEGSEKAAGAGNNGAAAAAASAGGGAAATQANGTGSGGSNVRLAGATNEVHIFDVFRGTWRRITPEGETPSPRAAHAAAAIGNMVVVVGGIGPAGLALADLYVLDFTQERPKWHRVPAQGPGPGARYAHTLSLVSKNFLVMMGGNDGRKTLGDAWALDTSVTPYQWMQVQTKANDPQPCPRMYASADSREDGLLLLCGGRSDKNVPLGDAFGLARHNNGEWQWLAATANAPCPRYQHASVFIGNRLFLSGGAVGGGKTVDEDNACLIFDTNVGSWAAPKRAGTRNGTNRRCRHACASVDSFVFIYGGLRGGQLLDDMLVADDDDGSGSTMDLSSDPWRKWALVGGVRMMDSPGGLAQSHGSNSYRSPTLSPESRMDAAGIGADADDDDGDHVADASNGGLYTNMKERERELRAAAEAEAAQMVAKIPQVEDTRNGGGGVHQLHQRQSPPSVSGGSGHFSPPSSSAKSGMSPTPDVRLHHRAVVVAADRTEVGGALGGLVQQLTLDQFENEGRRVSRGGHEQSPSDHSTPRTSRLSQGSVEPLERTDSIAGVHRQVIKQLLRPRDWMPSATRRFFLDAPQIIEICNSAQDLFVKEPNVLQLTAPVKIFGDLHGQFGDLMRLFDEYGSPSTAGDINYIDYLFLGDYVDRGSHSLETMLLLLALKIEHPQHVHLIRGNHEASDINALFGFRMECVERLGQQNGNLVWQRMNTLFNWLPLVAVIERKIICMHGGIGRSIRSVEQIEELKRPLTIETGGEVLLDLLWSDPTENDDVMGLQPSARGPGLVTFGPDRVKEFCDENDMQLIVRAHECVMDGFERFAQGHLITLFSATNYCGTANNAGAILVVGRDLVVVPKLIHPEPPRARMGSGAHGSLRPLSADEQIDDDIDFQNNSTTWLQEINTERPPTPPRGRTGSFNVQGRPVSLKF